jgi:hypothetical protein
LKIDVAKVPQLVMSTSGVMIGDSKLSDSKRECSGTELLRSKISVGKPSM